MNNFEKGELAETKFKFEAMLRGWAICRPETNNLPYDFAVNFNYPHSKIWHKVQVKYGRKGKVTESYTEVKVTLRDKNRPYSADDFDFLFVYAPFIDECWLFPAERGIDRPIFGWSQPSRST